MDNKPLELEALLYVESMVARYGYLYVVMNYDTDGGDFCIFKEDAEDKRKVTLLRCQSKGRCISQRDSVIKIPKSYVRDDFLVFVYLKPENPDDAAAFLYTAEDIRTEWRDCDNEYRLYPSTGFIVNENNRKFLFNSDRSKIINYILDNCGKEESRYRIDALSASDFYFQIWQRKGYLPSVDYLREVNSEDFGYMGLSKSVFLLCAMVILNRNGDTSLSIDWAFYFLQQMNYYKGETDKYHVGNRYSSTAEITYHRTFVEELCSEDDELFGYHLYMGDEEESLDAYVWRYADDALDDLIS